MASTDTGMPLDAAAIMSTVLEGILYGFSVLMFIGTIWIFTYKKRTRDVNRPIAAVAVFLFLLSTMHIVIDIIQLEDGLVKYRNTFPGGPAAFFADYTQEMYVVKAALSLMQTLLADGVVVYRCYVVWQSVRVVILPCMVWCAVAVCGGFTVYDLSLASDADSVFTDQAGHWVTAFIILTFTTNLSSSGLLAYRIWTIERNISTVHTRRGIRPIVRVLVDAAVLYSAINLSAMVCFALSNNGTYVIGNFLISPTISISFYMVFIRIAINEDTQKFVSTFSGTVETDRGIPLHCAMQTLQTVFRENSTSSRLK
ncbi:uncharacterized protein F5891DRAFT_148721 [Suillus fuscotomentosus]|uniref:Uncharacterized protein n=1 Tax=Suillus fuscotomentosus TaxID=1912939 RepID=A0AAD4HN85_9AGAM|nr:uncharacterized protein F5891DRAFT_281125 [Suillus fuscotomentosus]XP_041228287.1 uncharacterized protein F5891DRAFT_148721 [Suillus fuscotomentosus]KAG1886846.1 hypothetical protein F5891DRAFT_281125 [Suillus fuscotomentosus]KAG1902712.1 hypothetical protein F5891DRAFT_148721 [Suillus fuscotomentosus]